MAMCNGGRESSSPLSCPKKSNTSPSSSAVPSSSSCLKLSNEAYSLKKDGSNHSHSSVMSSEGGGAATSGSSSAQSYWSEDTDMSGSRLNIGNTAPPPASLHPITLPFSREVCESSETWGHFLHVT